MAGFTDHCLSEDCPLYPQSENCPRKAQEPIEIAPEHPYSVNQ